MTTDQYHFAICKFRTFYFHYMTYNGMTTRGVRDFDRFDIARLDILQHIIICPEFGSFGQQDLLYLDEASSS